MVEAPFPSNIEKQIIDEKQYLLNCLNKKYSLKIERNMHYIFFNLYKLDEISLFYYKNKFDLPKIIQLLKINPDLYNDFPKIFKLIEECYSNNKISLNIYNNVIDLILNINENNIIIHLIKSDLNLNEKFNSVIEQIKFIKKKANNLIDDRLCIIEVLLHDIENDTNAKINEQNKEIDIFQQKMLKDVNEIKGTNYEIKELKEKILNIKKQKDKLKI